MSEAKPYPTPLKYVPDQKWGAGYIQSGGKVLAEMRNVDDFPCQEEHGADAGAIQEEIDATGKRLVEAYNRFADARWFDDVYPPTEPGLYYWETCDQYGNPRPGFFLWEEGKPADIGSGPAKFFGPIRGAMQLWPMTPAKVNG